MPEVNQTTVSQWFIRREKKRDKGTLQPGIPPPPQEAVTEQPLPEAVPLPSKLPQVAFPFPFTFVLPENTAGTATLRGTACPTVRQPYLVPLQPQAIVPRSPAFIQPQLWESLLLLQYLKLLLCHLIRATKGLKSTKMKATRYLPTRRSVHIVENEKSH